MDVMLPYLPTLKTTDDKRHLLLDLSQVNVPSRLKAVPYSSLPNSPKHPWVNVCDYVDSTGKGNQPTLGAHNKLNNSESVPQSNQDAYVRDTGSDPVTIRRGSMAGLLPLIPSNHNHRISLDSQSNTPRAPNTPKSKPSIKTRMKKVIKFPNRLEVGYVSQARKVGLVPVFYQSHNMDEDKSPTQLSSPSPGSPATDSHFPSRGPFVNRLRSVPSSRSLGSSPVTSPFRRQPSIALERASPMKRSLTGDANVDPPSNLGPLVTSRRPRATTKFSKNNREGAQGGILKSTSCGGKDLEFQMQLAQDINRLREDFKRLVDFSDDSQTVSPALLEMALTGTSKEFADRHSEIRERLEDHDTVTFESFLALHFPDKSMDEIVQMVNDADAQKSLKTPELSAVDDFDDDLDSMWALWDLDGSGELNKFEFQEAMKSIGVTDRGNFEKIMKEIDKNGNGTIDKVEFMAWWNHGNHEMLR